MEGFEGRMVDRRGGWIPGGAC